MCRSADDGRVVIVTGTDNAQELYVEMIEQILTVVVGPATAQLDNQEFAELRHITEKLRPPNIGPEPPSRR